MPEPKLAVVVVTDTFANIRGVIDHLRRQTVRDQIEVIIAAPPGAANELLAYRKDFGAVKIVDTSVDDIAAARAVAIRVAQAKFVFVGETHSYPRPDMAEALLKHYDGPWTVIIPALYNGNPKTVLSWAGFLSDYGAWGEGVPPGEMARIPLHNAAFRRDTLMALGDRLAPAFTLGDELYQTLRAGGHKAYFEPAAQLEHVNVTGFRHWARERYAVGIVIANNRAVSWPLARRALYVLATPLIPVVLCWRLLPGLSGSLRKKETPPSTGFWIVMGLLVKTAGELAGYLGASKQAWDPIMHEYELHRMPYAGAGRSRM